MSLTIEFTETSVTLDEVRKLQKSGRLRLREKPQVFPNGNCGFYLGYARLPDFLLQLPKALKEDRRFCEELGVRFTYRESLRDGGKLTEGQYSHGESVELMTVQHGKDKELVEKVSNVVIVGSDITKINDAFLQLRSGKKRPTVDWSSPGTIAAPSDPAPDDKKEGSGEHELPPEAATETAAA